MWALLVAVFCYFCVVVNSSVLNLEKPDNDCEEYLSLEECTEKASTVVTSCKLLHRPYDQISDARKCDDVEQKLYRQCVARSVPESCLDCFEKLENALKMCQMFERNVTCDPEVTIKECKDMEHMMVKHCTSKKCPVCKHLYCRNGGSCEGPTSARCSCPPGYTGAFCQKSLCAENPCQNGGSCVGTNSCKCPRAFSGAQCNRKRLGSKDNPAPNAQAILDIGDSLGSGLYWIQPPSESAAAETYCDMNFTGGAWMLASYGYVHNVGVDPKNHGIPNMNNLFGYNWRPIERASSNGVINLPEGAVKIAQNASFMIMAAGNNPATGGIDSYSHVYRIYLRNNPRQISFRNHNRYNGAQSGQMHITDFLVEALKGESGTYLRYALGEALGITWGDSYPTGYGFYESTQPFTSFTRGPFFPSVHSGSGRGPCSGCTQTNYEPDVNGGSQHYTHHGWFTASGWDQTGQTSIWFK